MWSTDFGHFLYVASEENSPSENTGDGIDSCKRIASIFHFITLVSAMRLMATCSVGKGQNRCMFGMPLEMQWAVFIISERNNYYN